MDIGTELILIAVCIISSAFFSSSEAALSALDDLRIRNLIAQNNRAQILNLWFEKQDRFLNTILLGNTVAIVVGAILTADIAVRYLQLHIAISIGIAFAIFLLLGEVIPKTIARNRPQSILVMNMYVLWFFYWVFYPITLVMSFFSTITRAITGKEEATITADDIAYIIDVSEGQGGIEEEKQQMISSILDISDTQVRELMVPRTDMVAIPLDINKDELLEIFAENEHSRFPLYNDTLDNITGILYLKDMVKLMKRGWKIEDFLATAHEAHFVPETKHVNELLKDFQKEHIQMAIVVDEYGGVAGLITMEDILEEIVGDIWDEYDDDVRQDIVQISDTEYRVDARMHIDDFCEYFNLERNEDMLGYDTAAGLVYDVAGAIPSVADRFPWRGYEIVILQMSDNRVEEFNFIKLPVEEALEETINEERI